MNKQRSYLIAGSRQLIPCWFLPIILLAAWIPLARGGASGSWAVDANGDWSVGSNWVGGVVANGATAIATFDRPISATRNVTLNIPNTLGSLVFGNPSTKDGNNWNITGTGPITLDNSGPVPTVACWPLLNGGNSAVMIYTPLNSSVGFTKLGGGALWLAGNNSGLSGPFTISAGCVYNYNAAGLGAMSVSIASGSFLAFWTGGTFSQNFFLNGTGTSQDGVTKNTLYADSTVTGSGGSFTLNGTVTLNATSDIGGSSPAQVITFNGPVIGPGGLFKTGQPTLTLNASNTYTGGTTVNQGTLALGSAGSLASTLNIAIASGATFDVSAIGSYAVSGNTGLFYASGTGTTVGSTAAAIKGAAGGTVSLGSCPIELGCDGLHPALYIFQGALVLNGNPFIVNSSSPLAAGTYPLIQQAAGNVMASGLFSVTGTAVASNLTGSISVSGGNVNLVVQQSVSNLTSRLTNTNAHISYDAAPGFQNYSWHSLMYVLQRSTNLGSGAVWVSINTNAPATNGTVQIIDNFADLGGERPAAAYYRVQLVKDAQNLILAAAPAASIEQPFSFASPAGPQFTAAQTNAQYAAGAMVLPLVQQAFSAGAASVRIPPGDYRFAQETWGPNGVIYPLQFSDLQRDAQHPFTIDASGATFWFDLANDQAPTAHFCVGFVNCSNVIFCGATIDRGTRGHVEGAITSLDVAGNRIELLLSPGCTLPANFNTNLEQRVLPFKADGTFCAPLYALQAGGTKLKYSSITASATPGRCWVNLATTDLLATNANANWYNAYGEQGVLRVGDGLSCIYAVPLRWNW
jgi:autotransporter-associated beta strand protein